jgi:hypothetical protein
MRPEVEAIGSMARCRGGALVLRAGTPSGQCYEARARKDSVRLVRSLRATWTVCDAGAGDGTVRDGVSRGSPCRHHVRLRFGQRSQLRARPEVRGMYNHLLDALLRENLVGAVVPVQRHEEVRAHHGVVLDCRNHRVDTARKMLGQMARIATTRMRLAI